MKITLLILLLFVTACSKTTYTQETVTTQHIILHVPHPTLYYSFDDGINDSTGHTNGYDHNSSAVHGLIGYGRGFYSVGSGVQINESQYTTISANDSFSFNLWFNKKSQDKNEDLFLSYRPTDVLPLIGMVHHDNSVSSFVRDNKGVVGDSGPVNNISYNDGQWHMYTLVYNTTAVLTYIDGSLVKVVPTLFTGDIMYSGGGAYPYFMIGNEYDRNSGGTLNGSIDEVGFWRTALNDSSIAILYNSGDGLSYGDLE